MKAERWTLVAATLGSSMAFADGTIVNVALPAIQRELGADASQAQWVIESYALFLASLLLVGGALGDRYGRRRVFMIGVALFTAAALGCAFSATAGQLIAARAVQGIGAALLVPGSLALISAAYDEDHRGAAIGTWSAFSGIAAAIGPVIGGFLVDHYSWSWAFLLNVPIAVVLWLICATRVEETRGSAAESAGLDWPGAALATVGLAGVVYAFIEAPNVGWGAMAVIVALIAGLVALALFVVVEWRSRSPMLPLQLFRDRDFAGANLLTLLLYAALGGGLYFFPLNLIQIQGYPASAAGAALMPFVVILFVLSRWAGQLVKRVGARIPLVVGPLIAGAGFALFALPSVGGTYWTTFFPAVCVLGLGMAITIAPLTTTVMNTVGTGLAGVASGVNNAVSRAAGLLAIAMLGIVMSNFFNSSLDQHLSAAKLPPKFVSAISEQRQRLGAIEIPKGNSQQEVEAAKSAVSQSFVAGFRWVMLVSAGLAVLSALGAFVLISGKKAALSPRA
jgi:EmrB/QacA subfamily drug resistance transporter